MKVKQYSLRKRQTRLQEGVILDIRRVGPRSTSRLIFKGLEAVQHLIEQYGLDTFQILEAYGFTPGDAMSEGRYTATDYQVLRHASVPAIVFAKLFVRRDGSVYRLDKEAKVISSGGEVSVEIPLIALQVIGG